MTYFKAGVISYAVLVLSLFLLLLMLAGCVGGITGPASYSELSPAQIKALNDLQMDVYACGFISGPPPVGKMVSVYVPRFDKKPDIRFGENCVIR